MHGLWGAARWGGRARRCMPCVQGVYARGGSYRGGPWAGRQCTRVLEGLPLTQLRCPVSDPSIPTHPPGSASVLRPARSAPPLEPRSGSHVPRHRRCVRPGRAPACRSNAGGGARRPRRFRQRPGPRCRLAGTAAGCPRRRRGGDAIAARGCCRRVCGHGLRPRGAMRPRRGLRAGRRHAVLRGGAAAAVVPALGVVGLVRIQIQVVVIITIRPRPVLIAVPLVVGRRPAAGFGGKALKAACMHALHATIGSNAHASPCSRRPAAA